MTKSHAASSSSSSVVPGPAGLAAGTELDRWKPGAGDPWDRAKAAHLARRAGFGATPEEVDAMVAMGVDRTIDLLLAAPPTGIQDSGIAVLGNGEIANLSASLSGQRAHWLYEMAHTVWPLREKVALFWHDHFSVGSENQNSQPLLPAHINLFRRLGMGNVAEILIAVTKDPAMLLWLDNHLNGVPQGGIPTINENYGRELLELYALGVNGGYTQTDVVEASKCLSGWTLFGRNTPGFRASYHVNGPKTVLGTVINHANGELDLPVLIDVLLAWPACARFLVEKFWRWFVDDAPVPAVLDALAARFRADKFHVRSLLDTLLRCRAFFAPTAMRKLVKSPVEFTIGAIRNTGVTPLGSYANLGTRVEAMGLPLLRYSNPSGLDEGLGWIDSQALIHRANFASELTQTSGNTGIRPAFQPSREITRLGLVGHVAIVDHYLRILVDDDVPAAVRTALYGFMVTNDSGPAPWTGSASQVNTKVRGLVHLIMALPEYQMN